MNESAERLVKISELSEATGVSISTLKFYVKEGLIRPAMKTGRNMSWYDPGCIATIQAIKTLQRERFYPLSVIKRLLSSTQGENLMEMALLDAIHKVDDLSDGGTVGLSEAARRTSLSAVQIRRLCREGLIGRAEGRRYVFSAFDLQVCHLINLRMEADIPFEQSLYAFSTYAAALRRAAREDVDGFIRGAVLDPEFSAESGTRQIRVSDETLDRFIELQRKEYNREFGSEYVEQLYRFSDILAAAIGRLPQILDSAGLHGEARLCAAASRGELTGSRSVDDCARYYSNGSRAAGSDISGSIAGLVLSRDYFTAPAAEDSPLCVHCLRLCWLSLAPEILATGELAAQAWSDLERRLQECMQDKGAALMVQLRELYLSLLKQR